MKTCTGKTRSKKVTAIETPQHWPLKPGRDAGHKQRGGTGELGGHTALDHLVQGSLCKPMAR